MDRRILVRNVYVMALFVIATIAVVATQAYPPAAQSSDPSQANDTSLFWLLYMVATGWALVAVLDRSKSA